MTPGQMPTNLDIATGGAVGIGKFFQERGANDFVGLFEDKGETSMAFRKIPATFNQEFQLRHHRVQVRLRVATDITCDLTITVYSKGRLGVSELPIACK